jgi:hypothetical protein
MERGGGDGLNGIDRGKRLETRGRRAREKLGMPIADEGARLIDGRVDAELNQDDNGGGEGHRGRRVHGDAESAMVGVAGVGVEMGDLDRGQKGHEDEAHHHDSRGIDRLEAKAAAIT